MVAMQKWIKTRIMGKEASGDARALGIRTNAGKRRKLEWPELCTKVEEESFRDWPRVRQICQIF